MKLNGLPKEDREYFLENLGMQLNSGMDVLDSLRSLSRDMKSRRTKKLMNKLADDVNAGQTLWKAINDLNIFPDHVISLIRIGEQAGRLPQNLHVIVVQQRKDSEFRSRIRSAMMYPVFVLFLTVFIGLGIAWFILPRLTVIFDRLDVELPWITRVLIQIGSFFGDYGLYAVPGIMFGGMFLFYITFIYKKTKFIGQQMLFMIPGIRKLLIQIELGRMGYILGTLLDAGLPIVEAITSLADASTLRMYEKFYRFLGEKVNLGQSMRSAFGERKRLHVMIPSTIQQMIFAAEQSGTFSDTLLQIGETFERKTETTTKNLAIVLEPVLLVIIWIGVVLVALAVVLPVYSLVGGIQR